MADEIPVPPPAPIPAAVPAATPAPAPGGVPEWATSRIDELTHRFRSEERARKQSDDALEIATKELATLRASKGAPSLDDPSVVAQIEAKANVKATQMSAQQAYGKICDDLYAAGKDKFDDWDAALAKFAPLTAGDPQGLVGRPAFVQAAVATGAGAEVLHELSSNLDLANRVMRMTPIQMGVEMTKIAARVAPEIIDPEAKPAARGPSLKPKPITPVRAAVTPEIDPTGDNADNLSMADWNKAMDRIDAQRIAAGGRAVGR